MLLSNIKLTNWYIHNRSRFLNALIVIVHIAVIPAFIFVTQVGQPRFFGFFITILLSILFFDVLVVISQSSATELVFNPDTLRSLTDLRIITVLLASGLVVFVVNGLGLAYYLMLSLVFSLIVIRGTVTTPQHEAVNELSLVVFASLSLMISQLMAHPYFIQTADTITHTSFALRLADTGFIGASDPGRYGELPVLHVISASMVQVAKQPTRLYIGVIVAVIFQVAIISFYLLLRKFGEDPGVSLIAAALMAFAPAFLTWGTQNHPQSLSFFFLIFFLLILIARGDDIRNLLFTGPIIVAWILTHQLSVLMAISLIAGPVFLLYLYSNFTRFPYMREIRKIWVQLAILVISLLTHWTIVTQIIREPIGWLLYTSPSAEGVQSRLFLVQQYDDFSNLVQASLPEIVDKSHYAVWLAITGFGILTVALYEEFTTRRKVLLLTFIPAAIFYYPNPSWVPLQGTAIISRWGLMTLPFVVSVPAIGLHYLLSDRTDILKTAFLIFVVFSVVFISIGGGMSDPNITDMAGFEKRFPKYLSETDFEAMEHTLAYTNDTPVYGTSAVPFYLDDNRHKARHALGGTAHVFADLDNRRITIQPGLNVIQRYQLENKKARFKVSKEPSLFTPLSDEEVTLDPANSSKVFDTRATVIYHKPVATTEN